MSSELATYLPRHVRVIRRVSFIVIAIAELVVVLGPLLWRGAAGGLLFLHQNTTSAGWSAFAPWAALLVAIAAALLVVGQIREARRLRLEQARPFVMVDCEAHPGAPYITMLVVENFGTTAAFDVQISFSPELKVSSGQNAAKLVESSLLRNGIPTMPPGKRITTVFDLTRDRVAENLPMTYTVTVQYKDSERVTHVDTYTLDLAWRRDVTYIDRKDIHHVAKHLEGILKEQKKMAAELAAWRQQTIIEDE